MNDYPDVLLHIDGQWRAGRGRRHAGRARPGHRHSEIGSVAVAGRPTWTRRWQAAQRASTLAPDAGRGARPPDARPPGCCASGPMHTARLLTQENGKPLAEAKAEVLLRRRHHRVLRRRRHGASPGAWSRRAAPWRSAAGAQGTGGPGGGFHALELPDQPGGAQAECGALATGCSIIVKAPEETPASPAELVRAFVDAGVPAGVIGLVYGVPAEISELPDPAPGDPQGHLHRQHAGGQAAGGPGRCAHEARDDGTGRPRAGDRGRRLRCGPRRQDRGRRQVPQRRPGLHLADALPGGQQRCASASSPAWSPRHAALKVWATAWRQARRMGPLANPRRLARCSA
jgi:hypothetical protein